MASAPQGLSDQLAPLEDLFENGTVGLHLVAGDGTILRANRADYEPLGYCADEYVGKHIADFHADPDVIQDILTRLSRGEKLDKYRARLKAKDGTIRHVEISSSVCFKDGQFSNTRCFTVDVTDKVAAEQALEEARQRLSATYETVLAGIAEADADARFLRVNRALSVISGYDREELVGMTFFSLTHPEDVPAEQEKYAKLVRGDIDEYELEKRYVRKDGRIIWVEVMSSAVRGPDGAFRYGVRHVQDITARKEAEARQKLLLDELNHRVKNTLATVQSLAAQTVRTCSTADEFRRRFEPRLIALSAAHDRLTRHQWQGASLRDIALEELSFHQTPGREIEVTGPDVLLPPRASLSISMLLHELATNAVKHGSFSADGGRVDLSWEVERTGPFLSAITINWIESGGPPVREPVSKGFGSRLLRVTADELGGRTKSEYAADGLRWSLRFPLDSPEADEAPSSR